MFLELENVYLDKAKQEDWQSIYHNLWFHDESARYMLWRPTHSEEAAKERIRKTIEWQKEHYAYLIYEKTTGEAIGFVGFTEADEGVYEDTGIAIGPDFVGKGYGKQVVSGIVNYCFENLRAKKFVYSSRSKNEASKGLAKSLGILLSPF